MLGTAPLISVTFVTWGTSLPGLLNFFFSRKTSIRHQRVILFLAESVSVSIINNLYSLSSLFKTTAFSSHVG